jgi:methoxymalonate biosynthesis acyl carrier protein
MREIEVLQDRVKALLTKRLKVEIPSSDTDLIAGRYIDSLSFVDLLFSIEEEFRIRVPIEDLDLDDFNTVDRISRFIYRRATGES